MFVPLMFRGRSLGVIEAFDRHGGPQFRPEDERLLAAAAASAATAVATAQSVEQDRLRRTLRAAEEERRRWARELHDETLQGLGGLRVLLSSARRNRDVEQLHNTLQTAVDQIAQEIANLRALITELRPAALDELGLAPALEALFERVRTLHGLELEARVELEFERGRAHDRLDPDVETAVYRLVQESLSNAARHAHADHIAVEVIEHDGEVRVAIRDDGSGFDIEAPSSGFGLTGMRERVALTGGQLEIASSSAGTTISASLPSGRAARQTA
jgi:signal transduction histidine kinase